MYYTTSIPAVKFSNCITRCLSGNCCDDSDVTIVSPITDHEKNAVVRLPSRRGIGTIGRNKAKQYHNDGDDLHSIAPDSLSHPRTPAITNMKPPELLLTPEMLDHAIVQKQQQFLPNFIPTAMESFDSPIPSEMIQNSLEFSPRPLSLQFSSPRTAGRKVKFSSSSSSSSKSSSTSSSRSASTASPSILKNVSKVKVVWISDSKSSDSTHSAASSKTSKTSKTSNSRISEISFSSTLSYLSNSNKQRLGFIKHIPSISQERLLFPVDCEVIIDIIPFNINDDYKMHSIWKDLSHYNYSLKEYLIAKCVARFHELYDQQISHVQSEIYELRNHTNSSNNLLLIDLEKTFYSLCSDNDTDIDIDTVEIASYNEKDLAFGFVKTQLVIFRPNLMKLLHTFVSKQNNQIFDSVAYIKENTENSTYSSFFNIILIEMYFNWYYLIISDPVLTTQQHNDLLFKFKFVMATQGRRKWKKSLHAIEYILDETVNVYDKIIILDYYRNEWDHRLPKSNLNVKIWKNVFPIKANKLLLRSRPKDIGNLYELYQKRKKDVFLSYVTHFVLHLDTYCNSIIDGMGSAFLRMDWFKFSKTGITKIPFSPYGSSTVKNTTNI